MTPPTDSASADSERSRASGDQGFELPLPDRSANGKRRLRRRLFGFKAGDVRSEISAKQTEIDELRRDVAALWLAFGQHERTIRQVLEALERSSGVTLDPPGGRSDRPRPAAPGAEIRPEAAAQGGDHEAASIGAQLSDLDEVLAAIEQATQTLERGYAEELAAEELAAEAGNDADQPEAEAGKEQEAG